MKGSLCQPAGTSFLWRDTAMRIRERFNPRAPCGARRRWPRCPPCHTRNFNPRAPCGARLNLNPKGGKPAEISTHAPLAGRDFINKPGYDIPFNISTHAPLAGRDWMSGSSSSSSEPFQPTRPLRGATVLHSVAVPVATDFNPRAPCGARLLQPAEPR